MSPWKRSIDPRDGSIIMRARPAEVAEVERLATRAAEGKVVVPAPPAALAVEKIRSRNPIVRRLNRASAAASKRAAELEPLLADALRPTLDRAAASAGRGFMDHAGPAGDEWVAPSPDEVLDVSMLASVLERKLGPVAEAFVEAVLAASAPPKGLRAAGEQNEPELGIGFDISNPFAKELLDKVGAQVREVAESFREEVRLIIAEAHDEGLSIPETAERIQTQLKEGNKERATRIARTELSATSNGASLAAARTIDAGQELGRPRLQKLWLVGLGAKHARHELVAGLDHQTRPLKDAFDVNGSALQHPGDPNGPASECANCRCAIGFVVP